MVAPEMALIKQTRQELAHNLTNSLLSMTGGNNGSAMNLLADSGSAPVASTGGNGAASDHEPVWVESPECTACDDCITINSDIFKYNDEKLVVIANPQAHHLLLQTMNQCGLNHQNVLPVMIALR